MFCASDPLVCQEVLLFLLRRRVLLLVAGLSWFCFFSLRLVVLPLGCLGVSWFSFVFCFVWGHGDFFVKSTYPKRPWR
jgi:hypothetical protein